MEMRVDYVIGSGNHARSYLHRTADGHLIEMPVSWYSENGGYWAMSPGYDRPNQQDFRRSIAFNCMFCHNAYPDSPPAGGRRIPGGELPEGIDCQRCHGPGSAHVEAAGRKAPAEADSPRNRQPGAFVARAATRCVHAVSLGNHQPPAAQCRRALRTWAVRLPARPAAHRLLSVLRPAPHRPTDDNFEIAHAAYRLRKSKCFQASQMTCTTCHNPHDVPRGQAAAVRYNAACRKCHAAAHAAGALPAEAIARHATCRAAAPMTPYTW